MQEGDPFNVRGPASCRWRRDAPLVIVTERKLNLPSYRRAGLLLAASAVLSYYDHPPPPPSSGVA